MTGNVLDKHENEVFDFYACVCVSAVYEDT